MQPYTVTTVEDDPEVCRHLAAAVSAHSDLELMATADSVATATEALNKSQPDILLTDFGLPDGSGIELIQLVASRYADCMAMVVSGFQDEHRVFAALEAGAKGYISKHDESVETTSALLSMMQGGAPISPVIARLMLLRFQPAAPDSEVE